MSKKNEVFISKVLKRLYPPPLPPHPEATPQEQLDTNTSAVIQGQKELVNITATVNSDKATDAEVNTQVHRKLYTVSLPPAECILGSAETVQVSPEGSDTEESRDGEDSQKQIIRKHRRKRRRKKALEENPQEASEVLFQDELSKQQNLLQETSQQGSTDDLKMSKNKKRKLKKKRHKEKLRAAGLLKSTAIELTYQPEEGSSKEDDSEDIAKKAAEKEDDSEVIAKKAAEILDFLQATLEIYCTDNKSKAAASCLLPETVHCVLQQLETHSMPSADVALLHQLKSLVILQDIERLRNALDKFQEHSMMPPEEVKAVCSLFHYWISDILPVASRK